MNKLLYIGIDALDAVQVDQLDDCLPTLKKFRKEGFYSQFHSVWPPDSETAWASIYTGLNPAKHGIFRFVDPLQKTATYITDERDNSFIQGKTFWDIAGRYGKRVCVLFPHIGYPSWEVNGIMVSKASTNMNVSVTPESYKSIYDFSGVNDVKGFIGQNPQEYIEATEKMVNRQLDLTKKMLKEQEWDLFFSYWSSLDVIQHQFWSYCDPEDPTYLTESPYKDTIKMFYQIMDKVISELISLVDASTNVIIMSDHGHGMRPIKILNINRLLKDHGFLIVKENKDQVYNKHLRSLRNKITEFISKNHLGNIASKVLKLVPWVKEAYVSSANIDFNHTIAYITDMSGIKAYSYGGIQILRDNINGRDYRDVRDTIIALLNAAQDDLFPGCPLTRWVRTREELYSGPYISEFPDIVFELNQNYGAGWDPSGPLIDVSRSHNLYPGSHIGSNAVFLYQGPEMKRIHRGPDSMMDIAPTILNVLNIPVEDQIFDGKSIFAS